MIQPLPGMSYLTTSTAFYELQAQRQKTNSQQGKRQQKLKRPTRRNITQNRITSNIMSFNQATPAIDNSGMEISSDYQTSVLHSKYQLSGFRANNATTYMNQ